MTHTTFEGWHKSSYSSGEGENCVEQGVDLSVGVVGIRDTKIGATSPVLAFTGGSWAAFLSDLKTGDAA